MYCTLKFANSFHLGLTIELKPGLTFSNAIPHQRNQIPLDNLVVLERFIQRKIDNLHFYFDHVYQKFVD